MRCNFAGAKEEEREPGEYLLVDVDVWTLLRSPGVTSSRRATYETSHPEGEGAAGAHQR